MDKELITILVEGYFSLIVAVLSAVCRKSSEAATSLCELLIPFSTVYPSDPFGSLK